MTVAELRQGVKAITKMLLATQAIGGFAVRKSLRISDHDVEELARRAPGFFERMFVALAVAEDMLREPPPSGVHARWEEYQGRRRQMLREVLG